MKTRKTQFLILVSCLGSLLIQACGKDSVADEVARLKDRDRAWAAAQKKEMSPLSGDYVARNLSANAADFEITAHIVMDMDDTGASTPQPTVNGTFIVVNQRRKDALGNPVTVEASVISSKFDNGILVMKLQNTQTGNPAARVTCQVVDSHNMDCSWFSFISSKHFSFKLSRQ
jgi:hypothetical protein